MPERVLVLAAFVLSGACGLVYEVVWMRRLSLTFGITVFATSTVLAAFMAGLGLGSLIVGRRIDRSRNPIRVYALLEIGIGLYALAVPGMFAALEPLYVAVANRLEGQFLLFNLARAALAFAVLLVPTTLMGGTVPAIARYLVARRAAVGWNVGLLYALNTGGAVAGCLAAGFTLVGAFGMSRTVLAAAAVNVAIGVVLLVARVGEGAARAAAAAAGQDDGPPAAVPASVRLATAAFAVSGFTALAAEVVWTRVLVIHLHNTTYAFSVMLAVFLLGLALGDAALMRVYDRIARPLVWLGAVQALLALSLLPAAVAYVALDKLGPPSPGSWPAAVAHMIVRAGVVLLPSALLFGTTFPLVARAVFLGLGRFGRDLGTVYAANTLGAVVGSLAGGFLLVPLVGLRGTLLVLAATNAAVAAACWIGSTTGRARVLLASGAALAAVPALLVPRTIFFDALEIGAHRLIYYREGVTDTTGVWESVKDGSRIVTYGDMRGTAGTHTDRVNRVQGHLAHLLHPHPTRSLQICFGVGNTLAAAALHPEVERLDCVELSPHVRETAPYFWTNADVLADPKVRLIVDDGRNYLLRTRERYHVITLEPPDIYTAGVVNLYTEEFYRLAANALTDDGLLCQWIPPGEMSDDDLRMLVRAFQNVFPETSLWRQGKLPNVPLLLVGTKVPLVIDREQLARRMAAAPVRDDLRRVLLDTPEKLLDLFIAGRDGTRRWVGDAPAVTDDRSIVDFTTPRAVYSGFGFGYFTTRGAEAEALRERFRDTERLYRRLREPFDGSLRRDPVAPAAATPPRPASG